MDKLLAHTSDALTPLGLRIHIPAIGLAVLIFGFFFVNFLFRSRPVGYPLAFPARYAMQSSVLPLWQVSLTIIVNLN